MSELGSNSDLGPASELGGSPQRTCSDSMGNSENSYPNVFASAPTGEQHSHFPSILLSFNLHRFLISADAAAWQRTTAQPSLASCAPRVANSDIGVKSLRATRGEAASTSTASRLPGTRSA